MSIYTLGTVLRKERVKVAWSRVGLIFRTELNKIIYNSDNIKKKRKNKVIILAKAIGRGEIINVKVNKLVRLLLKLIHVYIYITWQQTWRAFRSKEIREVETFTDLRVAE